MQLTTLGEFLEKLRKTGQCEIDFKIPAEVREALKIKDSKVKFPSHQELDSFVHQLIEKEPLFEEKYPQEWALLKR